MTSLEWRCRGMRRNGATWCRWQRLVVGLGLPGRHEPDLQRQPSAGCSSQRTEICELLVHAEHHGPLIGGAMYRPTTSRTFSMNRGSAESLKVSVRCGCVAERPARSRFTVAELNPHADRHRARASGDCVASRRPIDYERHRHHLFDVRVTDRATARTGLGIVQKLPVAIPSRSNRSAPLASPSSRSRCPAAPPPPRRSHPRSCRQLRSTGAQRPGPDPQVLERRSQRSSSSRCPSSISGTSPRVVIRHDRRILPSP